MLPSPEKVEILGNVKRGEFVSGGEIRAPPGKHPREGFLIYVFFGDNVTPREIAAFVECDSGVNLRA